MKLQFERLTKYYGAKKALSEVSIELTEGIYGLLGPNGAGKSTMMNILTGNLQQSSGRILLDGADIRDMGKAFRSRIGYMPQQQTLYPEFRVEQFLYYVASLHGLQKTYAAQRIDMALRLVQLDDIRKWKIKKLSGGMKQRLMFAQAILADPDILILDEPTAGLDPKQRIAVRNIISEISLHKIVILSTHVVSDVDYISKELILLSAGQVIAQRSPQWFFKQLRGQVREIEVTEEQLATLPELCQICGIVKSDRGLIARVLSQGDLPGTIVEPDLEDVYLHYFGE
jgi:ABC-type multidrug transport system ATPase subunit